MEKIALKHLFDCINNVSPINKGNKRDLFKLVAAALAVTLAKLNYSVLADSINKLIQNPKEGLITIYILYASFVYCQNNL